MSSIGPLLSEYRKRSRLSQLDLSLLADVSSRHISFIETGRTKPSRAMILKLADVMDLPHKESNLLLHTGGYAPAYTNLDFDHEEMAPVRKALSMILENHNPYPALVVDGNWNALMQSQSQAALMSLIVGGDGMPPTMNVLEGLFREDCFKNHIANWEEVASHSLRRLRKQVLMTGNKQNEELLKLLLSLSPPANWQQPSDDLSDGPMLTIDFKMGDQILSMFSTLSQFGTALDTGLQELMIESYFPADEQSRELFAKFLNQKGQL
jgi:transcriptional regulator with XRE-family HTH domain